MRPTRRQILLAPVMLAPALAWPQEAESRPLWPGARHSDRDRARAIQRGLRFIYRIATNPEHFAEHGDDLLWCFYSIAVTAADPRLKALAGRMGRERARQWRRDHPRVPGDVEATAIVSMASASYCADRLGVRNDRMKDELQLAARRFQIADFLKFDPTKEPIPRDVPKTCERCKSDNARGTEVCRTCGAGLERADPYDVLCDALISTYFADRYGVTLGASFADVTQWIPRMRPYPAFASDKTDEYYSVAYAITHVVYTLNDYGAYRLRPEWLPQEFAFLTANLRHNIELDDPETMGEFLDSLKSFGLTEADPLIQAGVEFVLSEQNRDGSWGDPEETDIYTRYHSTWTAVDGLRDFAWRGEGVSFPEALRRVQREHPLIPG